MRVVAAAGIAVGSAPYARAEPQPYLSDESTALLFHLDDLNDSVAFDASGRMHHGRIVGTVLKNDRSVSATPGGTSYFQGAAMTSPNADGSVVWEDVGSGSKSLLCPGRTARLTIEGWFRPEATGLQTPSMLFAVQPMTGTGSDYELDLQPSLESRQDGPRALALRFRTGERTLAVSEFVPWDENIWYHVAVVIEPAGLRTRYRVYRTAAHEPAPALLASAEGDPLTCRAPRLDRAISFASRYGRSARDRFIGSFDDIRLSTTARTDDELRLAVAPTVADRIRTEVTAPNNDTDHPLPLASTWDTGLLSSPSLGEGYTPAWQLREIAAGNHILPAFWLPEPSRQLDDPAVLSAFVRYYQQPLEQCAEDRLPISFPGTQWEQEFTLDSYYLRLPRPRGPNVDEQASGAVAHSATQPLISPFGNRSAWRRLGQHWGGSRAIRFLQSWYPDPPKVIFISNNEATKLTWRDAAKDRRFTDLVGRRRRSISDDETRHLFGDGWISRYRDLQGAWRRELHRSEHPRWGQAAMFVGYNASGMNQLGRWGGWRTYSLFSSRRPDPSPLAWDGAMVSGYLMPGRTLPVGKSHYATDYWVFSPQVDYMNDEYFRREAIRRNPDFWFELGVWNGDDEFPPIEDKLASFDPPYTPARYGGMVQWGMWLLRPRVVRDFRGGKGRSHNYVYFEQVVAAVNRVYSNPVLQAFWRNSSLVANRAQAHPYDVDLPPEVAAADRMFMLRVDKNPDPPWNAFTEIAVFALARERGKAPHRQWLIYAQAPRAGDRLINVRVTIPAPLAQSSDHTVTASVRASPGGSFSVVAEGKDASTPL